MHCAARDTTEIWNTLDSRTLTEYQVVQKCLVAAHVRGGTTSQVRSTGVARFRRRRTLQPQISSSYQDKNEHNVQVIRPQAPHSG